MLIGLDLIGHEHDIFILPQRVRELGTGICRYTHSECAVIWPSVYLRGQKRRTGLNGRWRRNTYNIGVP